MPPDYHSENSKGKGLILVFHNQFVVNKQHITGGEFVCVK